MNKSLNLLFTCLSLSFCALVPPIAVHAKVSLYAATPTAKEWLAQGEAFLDKGDLPKALEAYDQVIALDPTVAEAYSSRCFVKYIMGDLPSAIADCDQVLRLNPKDASGYAKRGIIYSESGNFPQALKDFDQAILLDTQEASLY